MSAGRPRSKRVASPRKEACVQGNRSGKRTTNPRPNVFTDAEAVALMASGMGYPAVSTVCRIARLTRGSGSDRVRVTYSDLRSGPLRAHAVRRAVAALEAAGVVVVHERDPDDHHITVSLRDGWSAAALPGDEGAPARSRLSPPAPTPRRGASAPTAARNPDQRSDHDLRQ